MFMNRQIQKGKTFQQICVTPSSVQAVPLHLSVSRVGTLMAALITWASSLTVDGDPFGYRLRFP